MQINTIPKRKRIKLSPDKYRKLCLQVLRRDAYTCQLCRVYTQSPPHHVKYRSQGGDDCASNLITLCERCHGDVHNARVSKQVVEDIVARINERGQVL